MYVFLKGLLKKHNCDIALYLKLTIINNFLILNIPSVFEFPPVISEMAFYISYSNWGSKNIHTLNLVAAAAKSLQSCPTLCDPIDSSPPGFPVPGILQARTMEWVSISFSKAWEWKVKVKLLSHVWLVTTPWTAAYQAPPPLGFSRQEYWSGVPLPSPEFSCSVP